MLRKAEMLSAMLGVAAMVAVVGPISLFAYDVQAVVTYRTVALSGEHAPGTAPGTVFSNVSTVDPIINNAGQTAFWNYVSGSGVDSTNNTGLWSEGTGVLDLVARKGDPAPGVNDGLTFQYVTLNNSFVLNDAGHVAFLGGVAGPGVDFRNAYAIWMERNGSLNLVVREGDPAPGLDPAVAFKDPLNVVLNHAGQAAFVSYLTGPGVYSHNDTSIWLESDGAIRLVAREGDPAPGTEPGVVFQAVTYFKLVLNNAGQTAFRTMLTGTGIDSTNDIGIWSGSPDAINIVARTGVHAPGALPGEVFKSFGDPVINGSGETAFLGFLTDPRTATQNTTGIWKTQGGTLQPIAIADQAAPQTEPGIVFSGFGNPVLNDQGSIAFKGYVKGTGVTTLNSTGIWTSLSGTLTPTARLQDAAPGTEPGVVFAYNASFSPGFSDPVLNASNQIAFLAGLSGPGVNASNDLGVWATDPSGELTLIVRRGDLFDVNNDPTIDDYRQINAIGLVTNAGGGDGRRTSFNDAGQLAFRLGFTDNTWGIFVATIPEPGTLGMLMMGAGLMLRRGCRLSFQ